MNLPPLDFTGASETVRVVAESERLSFGHLFNPAFATEISRIDPLPHQRIAVYDHMLKQPRLRFLLADDAGAGKTIMAGLYIREMLSRRLLQRVLVVTPAGLVGNWQRELLKLFNLSFHVISGTDARDGNPFVGERGDRLIVSIDTLAGERMFARLCEPQVLPYDLLIFDEAHKLSCDRSADLRVRKTDRYKLAEALAGAPHPDKGWQLPWRANHLLLLTATPHMGKDYPYFAIWKLLQPEVITTPEAFAAFPAEQRHPHFLRRTKEEMVRYDGKPLYPTRISDTLGYDLTQGAISEQTLYDETTDYLRFVYNKAKLLNRSAAKLAMAVFQRRLASSTYALLRSFERRIEKLEHIVQDIHAGKIQFEQLLVLQRRLDEIDDPLESKTADEETTEQGQEEHEVAEDQLLQGVIVASLADLEMELNQLRDLRDLARTVYDAGHESKFETLYEIISDPKYQQEKFIIFTEHRDTLTFLVRRLGGLGHNGQIAQIHGGISAQPDTRTGLSDRDEQVEHFRKPLNEGGARFLVATEAAGEGINLQFCWIMINYDIPWNPARLEQRMGRIHRYGQKHDPVVIMNLVAPKTREGRVLKTLLDKLEKIRKELKSDKVFDSVGRLFAGVSIREYMAGAIYDDGAAGAAAQIEGILTKEQVRALEERERKLFGGGGDVARELPRMRASLSQEVYNRLLPGYVRQFTQQAAPLIGLGVDGDLGEQFQLVPIQPGAMDSLLPDLETYPEPLRSCLTFEKPTDTQSGIWLHPGEPVFERLRAVVSDRLGPVALRGAIFTDPMTLKPYLFHLALITVVREADPQHPELAQQEALETRLVGLKQLDDGTIVNCPVEHLLLLKGSTGIPAGAQRLAVSAPQFKEQAQAHLIEHVGRPIVQQRRDALLATQQERISFLETGFNFREAELATMRIVLTQKVRDGQRWAEKDLQDVRDQQRELAGRRQRAIAVIQREPELISLASVHFIAHALVVPSVSDEDKERYDIEVEKVAMALAIAHEEAAGATVHDVHTAELARAVGLIDYPGFDVLSKHPNGEERAIEVKGRAGVGDVEISANEWAKACNMRGKYWIYAVYDCATAAPRLAAVQDPFGNLLAKAKGSMLISAQQILNAVGGQ